MAGIPLSPTMAAPKDPFPSSTGIRAPLTLDDSDLEYSVSTSGPSGKKDGTFSGSSSDSEFLSDGFVSGEDELEMGSKRAFVSSLDSGILEETHFVKKYVLTRPLVKYPNEEFIQESIYVRAFDDSRPLLFDPNEEVVGDNDNIEDCTDRPSAAASDDGSLGEVDGNNGSGIESRVLDTGTAALPKQGMPIAQLSWDSDDDFEGSDTFEEESFSAIIRLPDSGFQESFGNAPKVRVLDIGEVEDSASQTENLSVETLEDSIVEGADNEVRYSTGEENHPFVDETTTSKSVAAIEGKDPIIIEEIEGGDLELEEGIKEPDPGNQMVEETNYANMLGDSGSQVVEHTLPSEAMEAEGIEIQAVEDNVSASSDTDSLRNQNLNIKETTACCQKTQNSEKMMNEIEQNEVEAHDFSAPNNVEYADGAIVFDVVESMNDAELSETKVAQKSNCIGDVQLSEMTESCILGNESLGVSNVSQALHECSNCEPETSSEANNDSILVEEEYLLQFDNTQSLIVGGSERVNTIDKLEEPASSGSLSCGESSQSHLQVIDAMTWEDSKDEPNTDAYLQEEEVNDTSALAAPQRAPTEGGLQGDSFTFMSADGSRLISLAQLASLGSTVHSFGPTTQLNNAVLIDPPEHMARGESNGVLSEEEKKKLEKLQQIRVKYLRIVHRLKQSQEDSIVAKVLNQLLLALGRPTAQEFSFDFAKQAAMELEAEGNNNLDVSLDILVIGKSGVGKSATINSIFGEGKAVTNAFEPGTTGLKEVQGTLDGIPVRVLDTPGLRSSMMEQSTNRKILLSIKKFMKKFSPDIVLYVDRLDLQTRDLNDFPLLKLITSYLGSSIWLRTILTLTHAASAPPEGPSGQVLSYELFVAQRSHAIRQLISYSVGNPHIMKPSLVPVSLVENSSSLEMKERDHILPFYEYSWRSKLMCLCYSMKILSEMSSTIRPEGNLDRSKFLGHRVPSLPLPYFLSSLLQSSAHPKLYTAQGGEDIDSDIELAYLYYCDEEIDDEYDQLPAFRPLRKSEIAKLEKEQRKAYFEEYDYRVKLLQKKQLKEEVRRARDIKKKSIEGIKNGAGVDVDLDQEVKSPEALVVPLPDMALPPAFDGDTPAYRYRFLELSSRIMTRPILDSHGWDHDYGFDGVNIEDNLDIAGQFPAVVTVQLTKDKRVFDMHLNSCVSTKHGEKGSSMAGIDIETIGKQLAYTLKTETKMKNFSVNKSAAGISLSFLAEDVITGLKLEDQVAARKNLILVATAGLSLCQTDAAYGANLAIRFKHKDYPLEQEQHLIGFSVMRWRGDNVLGLNLQSQFSLGRNSKFGVRAGLNSKKSGQISVGISSSNDLHITMLGLLPIVKAITRNLFAQLSES